MEKNTHAGLTALLTPESCVVLLIDHQPFQFASVNSHDPTMIANNVAGLARGAKVYDIPTILTTVTAHRGGLLITEVRSVFPDQEPIDRTSINAGRTGA
jgi:nicotinamidase-related amidase